MFSSFSGGYWGEGLLGYMVTLFLIFEELPIVFQSCCASLHSHQQWMRVPFSTTSLPLVITCMHISTSVCHLSPIYLSTHHLSINQGRVSHVVLSSLLFDLDVGKWPHTGQWHPRVNLQKLFWERFLSVKKKKQRNKQNRYSVWNAPLLHWMLLVAFDA